MTHFPPERARAVPSQAGRALGSLICLLDPAEMALGPRKGRQMEVEVAETSGWWSVPGFPHPASSVSLGVPALPKWNLMEKENSSGFS